MLGHQCVFIILTGKYTWISISFVQTSTHIQGVCACLCVCCHCVNRLTNDNSGDLVPAGPEPILDLTDEGGVDSIIHLPHCQLVALHHHCFWQRTRSPVDGEKMRRKAKQGGHKSEVVSTGFW